MGHIVESCCEMFGIEENQSLKKDEHYQLSGSKNQRIHNNAEKISSIFTDYEVSFDESKNVFNVLTKNVLPQKTAEKTLWIICYRKTWRLVFVVNSSLLITTSRHATFPDCPGIPDLQRKIYHSPD